MKGAVPSSLDAEKIHAAMACALESRAIGASFALSDTNMGRVDEGIGKPRSRSQPRTSSRRSVSRPRDSALRERVESTDQSYYSVPSVRDPPRTRSRSGRRRRISSSGEEESEVLGSRPGSSTGASPTTPSQRSRSLGRVRSCPRNSRGRPSSSASVQEVLRSVLPEEAERTHCTKKRDPLSQQDA
jgi:hypothetical protein